MEALGDMSESGNTELALILGQLTGQSQSMQLQLTEVAADVKRVTEAVTQLRATNPTPKINDIEDRVASLERCLTTQQGIKKGMITTIDKLPMYIGWLVAIIVVVVNNII